MVTVEVHLSGGLPGMHMVGLPETAVREARDRVKAALSNSGFDVPQRRVTISLAPADLPKVGGGFDLPIALGILAASRQLPAAKLEHTEFIGELSLGGALRGVRGTLPAAIQAAAAGRTLVVPQANAGEAGLLQNGQRYCAGSLPEVTLWLRDKGALKPPAEAPQGWTRGHAPDLADVVGQAARPACAGSGRGRRPQPAAGRARRAPARPCWPAACPASCRP